MQVIYSAIIFATFSIVSMIILVKYESWEICICSSVLCAFLAFNYSFFLKAPCVHDIVGTAFESLFFIFSTTDIFYLDIETSIRLMWLRIYIFAQS